MSIAPSSIAPSRFVADLRSLRPALAAVCAVLAAASLACSFDYGIRVVGLGADGSLLVEADTPQYERFQSADGGVSWQPVAETSPNRIGPVTWGGSAVTTPRGDYSIDGTEIIHAHGTGTESAYSAAYLRDAANRILQDRATFVVVTTAPLSIAYDDRSGNVIVAMGSQGVVVGSSDGRWQRVAVQKYSPTDFSVSARMGLLGSFPAFWPMLLLFLASFPAFAVILAQCPWREGVAVIAVIAGATCIIHVVYQPVSLDFYVNVQLLLATVVITLPVGPTMAFLLKRWPAHSAKRRILALLVVGLPMTWVALTFPGLGPWVDGRLAALVFSFPTLAAVALAIMAARPYWRGGAQWRILLIALAATFVGAMVPTLLWLLYVISGTQASWISVAVAAASAFVLFLRLKRGQRNNLASPEWAGGPARRENAG